MTNHRQLEELRNRIRTVVRVLAFDKLLTKPQIKKILEKTERGHYRTLNELYNTISNIRTKTTLANIFSGNVQAKKEYTVSDAVRYRNNKKLFGKTEHQHHNAQGGIVFRMIKSNDIKLTTQSTIENVREFKPIPITPRIQDQLYTYEHLVNNDINNAIKLLYKNTNVIESRIQLFIATVDHEEDEDGHQESIIGVHFIKDPVRINKDQRLTYDDIGNMKSKIRSVGSNLLHYVIGYRIVYKYDQSTVPIENITNTLYNFRAFRPSNDAEFHKYTTKSTNKNKQLCIYESFEHIIGRSSNDNLRKNYTLEQRIAKEGKPIETAIISGNIVDAIKLLNIKYNIDSYIVIYKTDKWFYINKSGVITPNIKPTDNNTKVYLLDTLKEHVAPSNFGLVSSMPITSNKNNKEINYDVHPIKSTKKMSKITDDVISFDFETFVDDCNNAVPYCCCVYGNIKGNKIAISFYGLSCADDFITWLLQYKVLLHHNKRNNLDDVNFINVYGYNNSNFDNKFIYLRLYKEDNNSEFLMSDNCIKKITYNNITFYDLNILYASGSLNKLCKDLKLGQKEEFDVMSVNSNNYNDMKDMVISYCMKDAELTYKLALDHLSNSTGIINNKPYNISDCVTVGSSAKKLFQQVFLNDVLVSSYDDVLLAENEAFFGGRTSIFRQEFKSTNPNNRLYYIDLNSSYTKAMTQNMCYKYLKTINEVYTYNISNVREIVDTRLYHISSYHYAGSDSNVINNLVERDENGEHITYKNYNKPSVHWGIEIAEAIYNGFIINTTKFHEYIEKPIFKDFSEYMYEQRLIAKDNNNASKVKFFKNMPNNLFGKWGQGQFGKTMIVNNFDEVYKYMDNISNFADLGNGLTMIELKADKDAINGLVRFSSYITAIGRVQLSRCMRNIGHSHIYYCATDSIFTDKMPDAEFLSDRELGKFKVENIIKQASFISAGVYDFKCFDNSVVKKSKSIKSDLLDDNDYRTLAEGKSIQKVHTKFIKNATGCKIVNMTHTLKPKFRQIV